MYIEKLKVTNVRNLKAVELEPSQRFNFLEGLNGSGKTSLLESVYLLTLGRSFRTPKIKHVISKTAEECTVFSVICTDTFVRDNRESTISEGNCISVGLEKGRSNKTALRINGKNQSSFASLSKMAPVVVIAPEIDNLVDCQPDGRRKMLDWGVFHVEHRFHDIWKVVQRSLKQRNAVLRNGIKDQESLFSWSSILSDASEELNGLRQKYFLELLPYITVKFKYFGLDSDYSLSYYQGWKEGEKYHDILANSIKRDMERGYTSSGPHRADIKVLAAGDLAKDICSRGQKKLISIAIRMAQIEMLFQKEGKKCVVLLDDLNAELDIFNKKLVCDTLLETQSQVFVTCINCTDVYQYIPKDIKKMFHVERGKIVEAVVS